jgi:hypothetical protein
MNHLSLRFRKWTAKEDKLVCTDRDAQVGVKLDRTESAVH